MRLSKILILLAPILIEALTLHAQCFCGDARFRLALPGLKYKNDPANYTISTLQPRNTFRKKKFYPTEVNGDTVNFSYATGAGLDSLVFVIESQVSKARMVLYVLHMHYDIEYYIDLTTFTPGTFLFDWTQIGNCQQERREEDLVTCAQMKFFQLQLVDKNDPYWPQSFVHHKIRPLDLQLFRIKETK